MANNKAIEKLKESNAIKDKYMLIRNNHITSKQLLAIAQKTPAQYIYKRMGKGGMEFDYVKGYYVKKVLNFVFGWLWDFQVIEKGREGDQVWVLGRLTIKNKNLVTIIIKEQFGRADIKFLTKKIEKSKGKWEKIKTDKVMDYGNDLKAAATDALKKCASELGIASDVYGKEEDIEEKEEFVYVESLGSNQEKNENPIQKTISDIKATDNKKTLENWATQIKKCDAWTPAQKKELLKNIEDKIKSL